MARARNIKPAFFHNDALADCHPLARLLFISLWCLSDREGRLENRPRRIKAQTFPYEEVDIDLMLDQLKTEGFIFTYEADGVSIIQINNWAKHQNPHHKEVASELPSFDESKHDLSIVQGKVKHDPDTVCEGYIPLSRTIRDKIFKRDGLKCNYCRKTKDLEVDHIIPISRGGNSVPANLQILCKQCNSMKHNHIVNQEESLRQGQVILESRTKHGQSNKIASCSTDSLNLIPDSLNPIPDPFNPIPDSGSPNPETLNAYDELKQNSLVPDGTGPTKTPFDRFWDAYGKKEKRKDCEKKWKTKKLDSVVDMIIADIKNRDANCYKWRVVNGTRQYKSGPLPYLNGELWNDEIQPYPIGGQQMTPQEKEQAENDEWAEFERKHGSGGDIDGECHEIS